MKILVCVSKAPDTTTKISFTDNNTKFNEAGVQFIVNPYDEWYALVRGLELKEAHGGTVTTVTVGKMDYDAIIRKALAIGADDSVRIDADPTDAYFVAKQIAEYAKDKGFDMILCGKETIDYNGACVPGMIAEFLDLPYISQTSKLDFTGGKYTAERDVQGGTEVLEVSGAFVISASKGLSEQRIPNMRGIMAARTKPLTVVPPATVEVPTSVIQYTMPPAKASCKMIAADQAEELIQLLHTEAKVI